MNRLRQRRLRFGGGFSPLSLFAGGAEGAWFDPSDLTTLFQDAAGTTPVTTSGQPVGLMFDKSKGLVLGPELITNGTFPVNVAGWSTAGGLSGQVRDTIIFPSGGILITSNGSLGSFTSQTLTGLVVGQTYQVACNAYTPGTNAGTDTATIGTQNASFNLQGTALKPGRDVVQNLSIVFVASGASQDIYLSVVSSNLSRWGNNGSESYFDNISVRELPGNHATQATGAARPTYTEGGGLAWLAFDGTDDSMVALGLGVSTSALSIFYSAVQSGGNVTDIIFGVENTTSNRFQMSTNISGQRMTGINTSGNGQFPSYGDASVNQIAGATWNGSAVQNYINGSASGGTSSVVGTMDLTSGVIHLGKSPTFTNMFTGIFSGGLIVNKLMLQPEISAVAAYLADKSGVTL